MWERRRFTRYEVAIGAEYMKEAGLASIRSSTVTNNISLGGICAIMSEVIQMEDDVIVRLTVAPESSLTALAKVKWVSPEAGGMQRCGLEFVWVSSGHLLSEYVDLAREMAAA
jgi:c-di-GMP-binding flagellar brake protein YcgR